ncbi:MAG: DNA gyrase subunit A [Nitrospirae bacterium RIFCSPLOWO2_02_42_7]|nr:MAG: DNA gyrase subunit A [Nitrospirae bacterium RIFCSPLOWO2_02_42_7]
MRSSYLDYAMSVIVGRALPDVRDGLKPVHRRILYAMYEMGVPWNRPYKKSARIVGDVIGKYHPHGDVAVYDTVVRLAQDFSMRYQLIDGQGNFGSVDGDPPAAMRYTEIRMEKIASEMLADIDKETVDFAPTYDGSMVEPMVLPTRIPNLLINGSSGIAVGMATNIPPHNLGEIIEGCIMYIDNPEVTIEELKGIIKGPDFPTAGFIHGLKGINEAYTTGRGIVQMRARSFIETHPRTEKESIIITEIPYQVNKAKLIEDIAGLVRDKKVEGISEIRDESDREGMRIVIEIKRGEQGEIILNHLYKHTQMQSSFGIIMLALVHNQPRVLNLKEMIRYFVEHRREIVVRRSQYELRKAEERAHILEGLKIALSHLDEVINLIKSSRTPEEARNVLISRFNLTEIQAQAILDMRLQRLTGLEREKLDEEYQQLIERISYLHSVLESDALVMQIIKDELLEIKNGYGDSRRTEIIPETREIAIEDLIVEEDMVITISHTGYIKRIPATTYRSQRRGGKGKTGMETKEEDFVEYLFVASTHNNLIFFTDSGKVYSMKVHLIPEAGRLAKGKAIVNLLQLTKDERVTAVLPVAEFSEDRFIIMATMKGVMKKTSLDAYSNIRTGGIIGILLDDGDKLTAVRLTTGDQEVLLSTHNGMAIRFNEDEIRTIGRVGRGVKGIELDEDDFVVGMEIVHNNSTILTVTERGFGKRTDLSEYRMQGRGGKGIFTIKCSQRNGKAVSALQVSDEDEIMILTKEGKIIRTKTKDISIIGRNTQGVKLIDIEDNDKVVGVATIAEREDEEEL